MNNPIINPWLIYAINAIHNIKTLTFNVLVFGVVGLIAGIFIYLWWRIAIYGANCEEDIAIDKKARLYLKRGGIALIIILLLNMVIPAKETMYTMVAMKYITVENINGGVETVKSTVDYVFEKIEELNSSEDDNEQSKNIPR